MSTIEALPAANQPTLSPEMRLLAEAIADILEARLAKLVKPKRGQGGRFLSFREAARLLNVDRKTTLKDLIDERKLKTVTVAGKTKVPMAEIERIEREGATQVASTKRRRATIGLDEAPNVDAELAKLRAG